MTTRPLPRCLRLTVRDTAAVATATLQATGAYFPPIEHSEFLQGTDIITQLTAAGRVEDELRDNWPAHLLKKAEMVASSPRLATIYRLLATGGPEAELLDTLLADGLEQDKALDLATSGLLQ